MDVGTALAVAQLVYDTTKDLYEYYRAWKHCDKDVEELRVQLLWLHDAFRVVTDLLQKADLSRDAAQLVSYALQQCNDAASELWDILGKVKKSGSSNTLLDKLKAQGRKACYPFRKSTIIAISEQLETCRDALNLAVDLLHLDVSARAEERLQVLDVKLTNGFDNIDTALQQLPAIQQEVIATNNIVSEIGTDMRAAKERDDMQTVLNWISTASYGQYLSDVLSRHKSGTNTWFLESSEFQAWRRGTIRTLFCPGHPGTGKTVLSASVINHLLQEVHSPQTPVAYLFCDYKRRDEQNAEHMLSALLRQIVQAVLKLPQPVTELYHRHNSLSTRPALEEIETTLRVVTHIFSRVYIVVDALDECDSQARSSILQFIRSLRGDCEIALLATSRLIPDVQNDVRPDSQLDVQASDHDIKIYVKSRLGELSKSIINDASLQYLIVETIVEVAKGMFLLARLHIDSLRSKRNPKAVKKALAGLPQGSEAYNATYEDAMKRICSQPEDDRSIALEAISWVVFAVRPLSTFELEGALAVEPHASCIDEDAVMAIDEVLNLCAGLLVRDKKSNLVRIVHYTAHEYVRRTAERWIPVAEMTLAVKCVTYISFPRFGEIVWGDYERLKQRYIEYPLYIYAANHWVDHYRNCESSGLDLESNNLEGSAFTFLVNDNLVVSAVQAGLSRNLHSFGWLKSDSGLGPHVAAQLGSVRLMRLLIDNGSAINFSDEYGRTPLWWAVVKKHEALVALLLETGKVDSDIQDAFDCSLLFHAVSGGSVAITKMLLSSTQADVNRTYRSGRTLLAVAAREGKDDLVDLLLNTTSVDPEVADDDGYTPLMLAAEVGHAGVVERLLRSLGVNVNAKAPDGNTALSEASRQGWKDIVQLLLRRSDVEVDLKTESSYTALAHAVSRGHIAVVELLMSVSKDPESMDDRGRTPMMWALARGDAKLIDILLDAKVADSKSSRADIMQADLRRRDHLGCSSIHLCAMHNWTNGARFALEQGIDPCTADHEGWTPLHWCAYFDSRDVAELLLRNGADVALQDLHGWICANVAGFVGHEEFAIDFLGSDRNVMRTDGYLELRTDKHEVLCDACDHVCVKDHYHCTQCPRRPGYDLCFRCIRNVDSLHPNHAFETAFRYSD